MQNRTKLVLNEDESGIASFDSAVYDVGKVGSFVLHGAHVVLINVQKLRNFRSSVTLFVMISNFFSRIRCPRHGAKFPVGATVVVWGGKSELWGLRGIFFLVVSTQRARGQALIYHRPLRADYSNLRLLLYTGMTALGTKKKISLGRQQYAS